MRRVILAETAGFCFGVKRAVELAEKTAETGNCPVSLGPIIHNRHVVAHLDELGVHEIASPEQAAPGQTVIIRSHGVAQKDYQALADIGADIVDATCPFVERIHKLVVKAEQSGRQPVIIGERNHPEVLAIGGWCSCPVILENDSEIQMWLSQEPERAEKPLSFVFQTTSTKEILEKCSNYIKKVCTNAEIFDTICGATEKRQEEANALSKVCDAMVVVGDASSSNTKHLVSICQRNCADVALVDNAGELNSYSDAITIGITAGASTPAWIIKEVNQKMSENILVEGVQDESFETLLEQSFKTLNTGDKVKGIVAAIMSNGDVYVELGTKHAASIPATELSSDPNVKAEDILSVGDEVEVYVVRVNDGEGTATLSKKRLDAFKVWDDLETARDEKLSVEGIVSEENKGGVVAMVKGIRVFIPASQTGIAKGGELASLVKQPVQMKITEVNRARRRVVGSIRDVNRESRSAAREKIWNEIEVGKKYHGTVKSLTAYGAFVDIGGVDGMVHVSELSWNRIKTPADVLKVGDEIDVYVISFDPEKKKISLGYKTAESNPWNIFTSSYGVGDVAKVKIVKLMTFGAFAEIVAGVDGLIHISQIANRRIGKPEDVLSEGQEVDAKIIDIDSENKRISLSIRALQEDVAEDAAEEAEEE